jgi:ubiquinone/menaquinone biosynthesis C-methylase UbiE
MFQHVGYKVSSFDINMDKGTKDIFTRFNIPYSVGGNKLPFKKEAFDIVTSIGVLEHVPNDTYSLGEIHRILRPGGIFFVANLPNKYSMSEFAARRLGIWHHDRLYNRKSILKLFKKDKWEILLVKHSHIIPTNALKINFKYLNALYNKHYGVFLNADKKLERIPLINYLSNEWIVIARKI